MGMARWGAVAVYASAASDGEAINGLLGSDREGSEIRSHQALLKS